MALDKLIFEDELFVENWEEYVSQSKQRGVVAVLKEHFLSLMFPIRKGISEDDDYRAATRRGIVPERKTSASGLQLQASQRIELFLHETDVGRIPVIKCGERRDFLTLVRALAMKNEPLPLPRSVSAFYLGNLVNWGRIWDYRSRWRENNPTGVWGLEFQALLERQELHRDKLILVCETPYSNVPSCKAGLSDEQWQELSFVIRLEHESTHYLLKRCTGNSGGTLQSELIADFAGLTRAFGVFSADLFLLFMGMEDYPRLRRGGRLGYYRGAVSSGSEDDNVMQANLRSAAYNLQNSDLSRQISHDRKQKVALLMAMSELSLEELASPEGISSIQGRAVNYLHSG